jgi:predicted Fe-Mo cluster-binding NifX family protein
MTGRGAGYCAGYPAPGYLNPVSGRGWFGVGRGGFPRGGGRGRAFGGGRGWWGGGFYSYSPYAPAYPPAYYRPTAEEEKQMLQDELRNLEEEIEEIRSRLTELEKEEPKKK